MFNTLTKLIMDEQEIFNQIKELQKQRTLLKKQDAALVYKINELRDKLEFKNIKKGYYTDNHNLFCRVCDIKNNIILVYELDTIEPQRVIEETYCYETFTNTYCKECTREEYNKALDKIVNYFKNRLANFFSSAGLLYGILYLIIT